MALAKAMTMTAMPEECASSAYPEQTRRVVINSRNECEVNARREEFVSLDWKSATTVKASFARAVRRHTRFVIAIAAALVLGIVALVAGLQAHASPATPTLFGTLDTQPATVAAEAGSSDVSMAMFEYNWASFEPSPGRSPPPTWPP